MIRGMVIDMNDEQLRTLADLQAFLTGTVAMGFTVATDDRYEFIARTVRRFGYARLKRADKAVVLRFMVLNINAVDCVTRYEGVATRDNQ